MIIFIRGMPGNGKTTISNILAGKLNWEAIHVDYYKDEFMRQNPGALFFGEAVPYSYKKIIDKLSNTKNNVIVEEIFRNKDFVQMILNLCKKNYIQYQWFKLVRKKKDLLPIKRKIRNTLKDLEAMEKQIDDIKIEGEIMIDNQSVDGSVEKIYNRIVTQKQNLQTHPNIKVQPDIGNGN